MCFNPETHVHFTNLFGIYEWKTERHKIIRF